MLFAQKIFTHIEKLFIQIDNNIILIDPIALTMWCQAHDIVVDQELLFSFKDSLLTENDILSFILKVSELGVDVSLCNKNECMKCENFNKINNDISYDTLSLYVDQLG